MKKIVLIVFYSILFSQFSFAQDQGDTTRPQTPVDTPVPVAPAATVRQDTVKKAPVAKKRIDTTRAITPATDTTVLPAADTAASVTAVVPADTITNLPVADFLPLFQASLRNHPYYNFFGKPRPPLMREKVPNDKDDLFYFMIALVCFFALIRIFYPKYMQNMTTLFFRVTMRQAQLRDQLAQAAVPSLLLNILFVMTGGMFLAFLSLYRQLTPEQNIWFLWMWGCALVMAVYIGKFIILKIVGWIFNVSNATDTYIFLIFLVNKMAGIFLIPVLVMMAFPFPVFLPVIQTLALVGLAVLLGYRFVISYKPIRSEIKLNRFHFFVYLCAFEIAPLLLIYKVLLVFVERTY